MVSTAFRPGPEPNTSYPKRRAGSRSSAVARGLGCVFVSRAPSAGAIYSGPTPGRLERVAGKFRRIFVARLLLNARHAATCPGRPRSKTWPVAFPRSTPAPLYVVGIGASAGGLEALEHFFDNVPTKTGMAFVVVQHLSPDFKSLMDEILARRTPLPISLVEDAMAVEGDHIYLIPPKKEMIISGGRLLLSERDRDQELTLPIDVLFSVTGAGLRRTRNRGRALWRWQRWFRAAFARCTKRAA